ncbi:signal peptidase [Frondihabitans sp. PhB188]|nr:signal peptidase [Frondihabitans sp. PhB188]
MVVALLARTVLAATVGMLFWAAAPTALGWEPTTVMTGSMMPRLHPGDIVVARPVATPQLHPGQVLLFDDPDHAGRLRLHRYLQPAATGMITTKGDANPTADSSAVDLKTVHGVGYLRVPYLGLPILWLRTGAWPATLLVGIALLAAGILTRTDKTLRCAIWNQGCTTDSTAQNPSRQPRRLFRRASVLACALIIVAALIPEKAHAAAFAGTTRPPQAVFTAATATAPTGVTCTNNPDSTATISWTYTDVAANSFDVISGGTVLASSPGTGRTARISASQLLNLGTTWPIQVRTNLTATPASWSATSTTSTQITVTALLGLAAVRCS